MWGETENLGIERVRIVYDGKRTGVIGLVGFKLGYFAVESIGQVKNLPDCCIFALTGGFCHFIRIDNALQSHLMVIADCDFRMEGYG